MWVRNAVRAARQRLVVAIPKAVQSAELDCGHLVYADMELGLMMDIVRRGLVFANSGKIMLMKKVHKKWSSFLPALQAYLMQSYEKAARV